MSREWVHNVLHQDLRHENNGPEASMGASVECFKKKLLGIFVVNDNCHWNPDTPSYSGVKTAVKAVDYGGGISSEKCKNCSFLRKK